MRRAALLVATVVLAACSAHTGVSLSPSATGTVSRGASPSPSPTKRSAHVVSARQALYVYQNSIWLYDVKTNTTHQVTRGGNVSMPKWIDANHFSFVQDGAALKIADLKAATTSDVLSAAGGIQAYGWSPGAQTVAYIETDSNAYPHLRYFTISDGTTQSVATLARALGRGADASDEAHIEYSKDGAYVLVVYTPADGAPGQATPAEQSQFQIRSSSGALAYADDLARDPTMGVFSRDGKTAYWRDSSGVRAWSTGGSTRTLRTLQWFDPWPSPDGSSVAFDTGWESLKVRVKVLNLKTAAVTTASAPARAFPVFVGPHTVWAQEIVPCGADCPGGTQPGARVFSIDTGTRAEKLLPIQSLSGVDVLYQ